MCGTKFCRIEDAELGIDDSEIGAASLPLSGPAEHSYGQTSFTNSLRSEGQQQPSEVGGEGRRPMRRSPRLLDLVQRVRINIPPLNVTPSTITALSSQLIPGNISTGSSLEIGQKSDTKPNKRREEITSPYRSSYSKKKPRHSVQIWECCECGESSQTTLISCCTCGHYRCDYCNHIKSGL